MRLTSKAEIRRRLNSDRAWSLYALIDLDDGMFEQCDWWSEDDSLALVFRALDIRPIFLLGHGRSLERVLESLPERSGYLNVKPEQLETAERVYRFQNRNEMRRMFLEEFAGRKGDTEPLDGKNLEEVERLYAQGAGGGIAFGPFQLDTGFFRGIRRDGELVAVAGVHGVSRDEGVAAMGNIFTHPSYRGQGLAQTAASATVCALKGAGIEAIGLNVECSNAAAVHAYERLGFRTRCHYYEGVAERIAPFAKSLERG